MGAAISAPRDAFGAIRLDANPTAMCPINMGYFYSVGSSLEMEHRVQLLNQAPLRAGGRYVLYWAQSNRRVDSNQALAFAAQLANQLRLPLLFYEGLTCSHPHANDRLHAFVLEGVPDNAKRAASLGIGYVFYLRRGSADPNDVLFRLAADAVALVTDDYQGYLVRNHNRSVSAKIGIPYYA